MLSTSIAGAYACWLFVGSLGSQIAILLLDLYPRLTRLRNRLSERRLRKISARKRRTDRATAAESVPGIARIAKSADTRFRAIPSAAARSPFSRDSDISPTRIGHLSPHLFRGKHVADFGFELENSSKRNALREIGYRSGAASKFRDLSGTIFRQSRRIFAPTSERATYDRGHLRSPPKRFGTPRKGFTCVSRCPASLTRLLRKSGNT
jgi:hypothetical protein